MPQAVLVFAAHLWDAEFVDQFVKPYRVLEHKAQNCAEYRDFAAEELQRELLEGFGWPQNYRVDKQGDDGASTLTVRLELGEEEVAALKKDAAPLLGEELYECRFLDV